MFKASNSAALSITLSYIALNAAAILWNLQWFIKAYP
jgi:hypothetical protein